jgi:hypothetical protein
VCFEVRVDLKLALGSVWRRHNGGRGSGRQLDFLNLAVEEITLSHNASTLLDAPYVASSSSFYRSSSSYSPAPSSVYACAY